MPARGIRGTGLLRHGLQDFLIPERLTIRQAPARGPMMPGMPGCRGRAWQPRSVVIISPARRGTGCWFLTALRPSEDNPRTATPPPAATPQAAASRAPAPQPQPQFANATAAVSQFYQDITDHNYAAAWAAGGRNVSGGVGYDAWVAGYGTTESISLGTFSYFGSGQVQTVLSALQTSGAVYTYTGTYTVQNGIIVGAHIVQD
jgi:hypothetical protein